MGKCFSRYVHVTTPFTFPWLNISNISYEISFYLKGSVKLIYPKNVLNDASQHLLATKASYQATPRSFEINVFGSLIPGRKLSKVI